jgi:hypothetical protein
VKKRLLTYLVAIVFLFTGASAYGAVALSSQVTMQGGMFIEISGATGDVSWVSPDALCSSTWGCLIDWILFVPGAQNDVLNIKWYDDSGIDIFPNVAAEDAYDAKMVYYGGDAIQFYMDYSGSTLSTGAKVLIKLSGPMNR